MHELLLRGGHIQQRLARLRFRKETHKIDRVPLANGHADFRVVLESADAWAMARPRIDHYIGAAFWINRDPFGRQNAKQRVVGRMFEFPRVENDFVIEVKDRWFAGLFVLAELV